MLASLTKVAILIGTVASAVEIFKKILRFVKKRNAEDISEIGQ